MCSSDLYALVTKMPGPQQSSQFIAFTSNRTPSRLAAVEWFTEARHAAELVRAIRKPDGSLPQNYQVILKVRFMNGVPTETSYVAHRELAVQTGTAH